MPMIDVTLPEGALSAETRDALADRLTTTLLHWEGAGDYPVARQIAWVAREIFARTELHGIDENAGDNLAARSD